jgi:hypothetical protein
LLMIAGSCLILDDIQTEGPEERLQANRKGS